MSNLREATALIRAEFVQRLLSNSENIGQGFRFVVLHNWLAQPSSFSPDIAPVRFHSHESC